MTPAKFATPGTGPLADRIGWFDFGPGFTLVTGAAPVHVINSLPGGYTVEFDISSVNNAGVPVNFIAVTPPTFVNAPFGQTGYTGIAGQIAMYSLSPAVGITSETIHIDNILVKNSKGVATTTYRWVTADAEETGEIWSSTTDGSVWALLANLAPTNGNPPTSPVIAGVGTATVSEVGNPTPPVRTSGPVYISNSPVNILAATTAAARQAFAFGIVTTDREQAISDLIKSVSMEQEAIAHIINAEGEKIQAALTVPNVTVDQLMSINKSVADMTAALTSLEMVLQNKLETLSCDLCPAP